MRENTNPLWIKALQDQMVAIEVFRAIIPMNWMLNDNSQQHFKAMMGKIANISRLCDDIFDKGKIVSGFVPPSPKLVRNIIEEDSTVNPAGHFILMQELWKAQTIRFDLGNYGKTFKEPIDAMTNKGYWADDNWKYISPLITNGGGPNNWNQAFRYENDGLPDKLTPEFMVKEGEKKNSTLIRLVLFK